MRYDRNWLYHEYVDIFKSLTGVEELEDEEKEFLRSFFDTYSNVDCKNIYYSSVYRFKRFYPKAIVYFLLKRDLKKAFIIQKAPISLIKISNKFSEKMLFDAMKAYCKISD